MLKRFELPPERLLGIVLGCGRWCRCWVAIDANGYRLHRINRRNDEIGLPSERCHVSPPGAALAEAALSFYHRLVRFVTAVAISGYRDHSPTFRAGEPRLIWLREFASLRLPFELANRRTVFHPDTLPLAVAFTVISCALSTQPIWQRLARRSVHRRRTSLRPRVRRGVLDFVAEMIHMARNGGEILWRIGLESAARARL